MLYVGTSGWQYADWRGALYPQQLPQSRWLEHYAERFETVEVNNTFYRLPPRSTFEDWRVRTPPDFHFAVKASRFLTHVKRLKEPKEPVARFLDHAGGLGQKLGPILLQLPPTMRADAARLAGALDEFPSGQRLALEFRHESWFTDEIYSVLRERCATLVIADRLGKHSPLERTADWYFVRFHQGTATPQPCYGDRALASWAERIAAAWGADAGGYAFFNNDPGACAPRNAARFAALARRAGLQPTRAPEPRTIPLSR
jgi:uncharacterized protein YecE (DUF72 family)